MFCVLMLTHVGKGLVPSKLKKKKKKKVIDTKTNLREPSMREVVDHAKVLEKTGLLLPASTSLLSDFLSLDSQFNIKGR
ncbi:unnamed protein product [Arabidopsis halleri]